MADVACFCGCYFSFEGSGAGACPRCGKIAGVIGGSLPEDYAQAGRGNAVPEVPVTSQVGWPAGTGPGLDEAIAFYGMRVLAGHVLNVRERQ